MNNPNEQVNDYDAIQEIDIETELTDFLHHECNGLGEWGKLFSVAAHFYALGKNHQQ